MTSTLIPVPELRAVLDEQRRFRLEQLAALSRPGTSDPARDQIHAALMIAACRALADIEAALHRIDTGRYGECVQCAEQIPVERLQVIPQAAMCAPCQRAADLDT